MLSGSGQVVEFFDSGKLLLGCVTNEAKNRIQIRDQNGREHSVAPKQVVLRHSDTCEPHQFARLANDFLERIRRSEEEIDTILLWETLEPRNTEHTAEDLAELYFGDVSSYQTSALFRALMSDSVRFKFRAGNFLPRTAEQVEEQLHAERKKQEKEDLRDEAISLLRSVLDEEFDETEKLTDPQELILRRLEGYLQDEQDDEVRRWLSSLPSDSSPKMTAFEVLSAMGRIPENADPWLMTSGITTEFGKSALEECAALAPYQGGTREAPEDSHATFCIDDEGTLEIDDALTVRIDGDQTEIEIHISDVTYFVGQDSFLDREAHRRRSTLYLPQQIVRMFPERLSCELASLVPGKTRPVVTLVLRFDQTGEVVDWSFQRKEINVARPLTYIEADQILARPGSDSLGPVLENLERLTSLLMEERIGSGALVIKKPEVKVSVSEDKIKVEALDTDSPSRRIISELMIAANNFAARYAIDNSIPFIFRAQSPPSAPISVPQEYDPVQLNEVFSKLERGKLTLIAQEHAGLGLEAYSQVTSPIRRFLDLVLQRQLVQHLEKGTLAYTSNELIKILGTAQEVEGDIRAIERKANRYFLLRYLQQEDPEKLQAIVLKELSKGGYLVEMSDLYIRGHLAISKTLRPGEVVEMEIDRIDPEANILVFRED